MRIKILDRKTGVFILIFCIIGILIFTFQNDIDSILNYNQELNQHNSINYEVSGYCSYVVDGDTLDVDGVGRIRLVGINAPEVGQSGYKEAKDFVKSKCLGKIVGLNVDDAKHCDKYGRILAVVYSGDININAELIKRGYAEVMYVPPSEFNQYSWL